MWRRDGTGLEIGMWRRDGTGRDGTGQGLEIGMWRRDGTGLEIDVEAGRDRRYRYVEAGQDGRTGDRYVEAGRDETGRDWRYVCGGGTGRDWR